MKLPVWVVWSLGVVLGPNIITLRVPLRLNHANFLAPVDLLLTWVGRVWCRLTGDQHRQKTAQNHHKRYLNAPGLMLAGSCGLICGNNPLKWNMGCLYAAYCLSFTRIWSLLAWLGHIGAPFGWQGVQMNSILNKMPYVGPYSLNCDSEGTFPLCASPGSVLSTTHHGLNGHLDPGFPFGPILGCSGLHVCAPQDVSRLGSHWDSNPRTMSNSYTTHNMVWPTSALQLSTLPSCWEKGMHESR